MDLKNLVLTPPQMRTAELSASAHGVSVSALMANAGETLGRRILGAAQKMMKKNILLICGSGNNGGDGYVAADFLLASAASLTIVTCGMPKTDLAKSAFAKVEGRCEMITLEKAVEEPSMIDHAEIIVDCVFGIGFHGELPHELQRFFLRCTLSSAYLIACDCPSGINCMSGRISPGAFEGNADEETPDLDISLEVRDRIKVRSLGVNNTLRDEIVTFEGELKEYGITMSDLVECSPKSQKTRKGCADIIQAIFLPPSLVGFIKANGKIPATELLTRAKLQKKLMERHRKYLIAATVILSGDYPKLSEYVKHLKPSVDNIISFEERRSGS